MTFTYKNPRYNPLNSAYGPKFYSTDNAPAEYRGYLILQRTGVLWDVVKDDVCVTQLPGQTGARQAIDKLIDAL